MKIREEKCSSPCPIPISQCQNAVKALPFYSNACYASYGSCQCTQKGKNSLPPPPSRARAQPSKLYNALNINYPAPLRVVFCAEGAKVVNWSCRLDCVTAVTIIALFIPAGGVLLGGYLVRRFDLKKSLRMAARFCVIASIFTVAGSSAWFIPGCGVPDLAGVIAPYSGRCEKKLRKGPYCPPS